MKSIVDHMQLIAHPAKSIIEEMIHEMESWPYIVSMVHNFSLSITYTSSQVKKVLGYDNTEWNNDFLSAITHPDDVYTINEQMTIYIMDAMKPYYDRERPIVMKLPGRMILANGKPLKMEFSGVILQFNENGMFRLGLGAYQDISEGLRSKQDRDKLTRKLEEHILEIKRLYHNIHPCHKTSPPEFINIDKSRSPKIHIVDAQQLSLKIKHGIEVQKMFSNYTPLIKDESIISGNSGKTNLEFINKVVQFIEENLDNPEWTTNLLADKLNMSRTHLHRKIKKAFEIPAAELIKRIRIDKASNLLKREDQSVTDVAYSVGFNDSSYFTKCFRKAFGVTPSEYKKN